MDPSSHVLGLPTTLCRPRRLCCRGRKDCVPVLGSWLLIWLSLAGKAPFPIDRDICPFMYARSYAAGTFLLRFVL